MLTEYTDDEPPSFALDLWNQSDTVQQRSSDGIALTREIASFIGKIAACEADYAKNLRKVCKSAVKEIHDKGPSSLRIGPMWRLCVGFWGRGGMEGVATFRHGCPHQL